MPDRTLRKQRCAVRRFRYELIVVKYDETRGAPATLPLWGLQSHVMGLTRVEVTSRTSASLPLAKGSRRQMYFWPDSGNVAQNYTPKS